MVTVASEVDPTNETAAVAIIGMGCRLPNDINSPDHLKDFVLAGRQATGEIQDRWEHYARANSHNLAVLRRVTKSGSFLADVAGFDAEFFGITPREAELIDPQQRLMLEVAWQAVEDAGMAPDALAGSDAGVFVGVGSDDYGRQMLEDLPGIEAWSGIGGALCGVANRVSYVLDLHGPSLSVDTACSSSLVAIHLACQALRLRECTVALAGGVNVIAAPGLTLVLDAAGATARDGRCKSFAADADGYGRGEGAGVVVLKLLADALRDGDRVLAVVRGSAVSQDGRTDGIMAPNGAAQEQVIRQALRRAGVAAGTVDYVEAHGTGTRRGDPIEAAALSRVYGAGRMDRPCLVGSVKSNIGHLEAAAGVVGVINGVLAMRHTVIPPIAGGAEPNPEIPWADSGLRPVTAPTPWPARDRPRRVGVSGFGYGGTVAHVVLEQAPAARPAEPAGDRPRLFVLSSMSEAAVRADAAELGRWLTAEGAGTDLADVAHTLIHRRALLTSRVGLVAGTRDELVTGLTRVAEGATPVDRSAGNHTEGAVWVFSGHGSQWSGMGRELLSGEPEFAATLAAIEPVFLAEFGLSPRQALIDGGRWETDVVQPLIFAVQVGLAAALRARGLRPAAVIGHSVGEIAAAVTAGVLSLADGARLVCRRSALLRRVTGAGGMAMVGLSPDEVATRLAGRRDVVVAIAASPTSTVISGVPDEVHAVCASWRADGIGVREVASDVAFHSPMMDPLLAELVEAASGLAVSEPDVPLYSTALPQPRTSVPRDGLYWAANLRNAVRLDLAVAAAAEDGRRVFVELSPHPVVTQSIEETIATVAAGDVFVTGTLRRNKPECAALLGAVGALYCHDVPVDLAAVQPDGELASLPVRRWQHRPYWRTPATPAIASSGPDVDSNTLLGQRVPIAGATTSVVWQNWLTHDSRPYPGTHPIHGVEVMPAAVVLHTFLTATDATALSAVDLRVPLAVTGEHEVQVVRTGERVRLASRVPTASEGADADWIVHADATRAGSAFNGDRLELGDLAAGCAPTAPDRVTDRLRAVGVGAVGFPWTIGRLGIGNGEVIADVHPRSRPGAVFRASLLDAVFSIAPLVFADDGILRMPSTVDQMAFAESLEDLADPVIGVVVHVRRTAADTVDVVIAEPGGQVIGQMLGLRLGTVDGVPGQLTGSHQLVYRMNWTPAEPPASETSALPAIALVGGDARLVERLTRQARKAGTRCTAVAAPDRLPAVLDGLGPDDVVLVLASGLDEHRPTAEAAGAAAWLLASTAQVLAARPGAVQARLWALTARSGDASPITDVSQASTWGLARVLGGEHPDLWGGLVDIDPEADLAPLFRLLATRPQPDIFVLRGGTVRMPRLGPVTGDPAREPVTCAPDGTYLVTGAFGALGEQIATWLVERGARRLVLASRTQLPPRDTWDVVTAPELVRRIDIVRSIEARGAAVRVLPLDIADRASATRLLRADALDLPPVKGVVHAAGVLDNRLIRDLDESSLWTVLRPKVAGALVLDELFPPGSVDFFVLFSSLGLQLGIPGQASYAAANAALDALAGRRHAAGGGETLSIGWTSWRGQGMAVNDVVDAELADRGIGAVSAEEAFRAWEYASARTDSYVAVLRTAGVPNQTVPVLADLGGDRRDDDPAPDGLSGLVRELNPDELARFLVDEVRGLVSAELAIPEADLDADRPLVALGADSVMAVAIRRQLSRRFGISLPGSLIWAHPTIAAIAEYLGSRRLTDEPAAAHRPDQPAAEARLATVAESR